MNAVVAVENKKGERLELTKDPDYIIGQIDGLGPPTAQINTSKMVGYDGETFWIKAPRYLYLFSGGCGRQPHPAVQIYP